MMFHISSSCDHQKDPWSYNFMRVMSRAFRLHQNIEPIVVVDLRSLHLITSSLRLVNNTSSRKRLTTLSYHKLTHNVSHLIIMWSPTRSMIIQLYARHVTSVSIPSKLCTHRCRRSAIPASHHFITSSRITSCRHASVMKLTASSKNFTRISIVDRFDFFKSLKL